MNDFFQDTEEAIKLIDNNYQIEFIIIFPDSTKRSWISPLNSFKADGRSSNGEAKKQTLFFFQVF